MSNIMNGYELADGIKGRVAGDVKALKEQGIDVGLGLLLVGSNPASRQYFRATLRACEKTGIKAFEFNVRDDASLNEILNIVHDVNRDERIHGLLPLFPLPARINARRVVNEILPEKDVDGLGSVSVGRLAADESMFQIFREGAYDKLYNGYRMSSVHGFLPCTPFGVIRLIEHYNVPIKGAHVVVIGKSIAVGKPLSLMLLAKEATVTTCHRETRDLAFQTKQADIICSATGRPGLLTGDMIKDGAVVVDIGIKMLDDGSITGDVDFASVAKRASLVTPVPGGVGPVTIAMLLKNTVRSAQRTEFMKSPLTTGG